MTPETVQVLSPAERPALDVLLPATEGAARPVVWPGSGARLRAMHRISLGAGGATRALRHPGEAVYYVVAGGGLVRDVDAGEGSELIAGSMVHVEPRTAYSFSAAPGGLELVGGPGPADPACYRDEG